MSEVVRVVGLLEEFTESLVKRMTLEITSELIESTPVDTGWARANWVPSIGAPVFSASSREISRENREAQVPGQRASQAAGQAAVAIGYTIQKGPIYISNGVPYIVDLNMGTSAQAPAGFVEAAIEQGIRVVGNSRGSR